MSAKQKGGCVVLDNIIVPMGLVVAQKKLKDAMDDGFSLSDTIQSTASKVIDGSIFDSFLEAVNIHKTLKSGKKTRKNRQRKNRGTRKIKIF